MEIIRERKTFWVSLERLSGFFYYSLVFHVLKAHLNLQNQIEMRREKQNIRNRQKTCRAERQKKVFFSARGKFDLHLGCAWLSEGFWVECRSTTFNVVAQVCPRLKEAFILKFSLFWLFACGGTTQYPSLNINWTASVKIYLSFINVRFLSFFLFA